MRIALYHNLPSGGAKRAAYEMVKRLAQEHCLHVFTLSAADQTFCDLRPFAPHTEYPCAEPKVLESPFGRLNKLFGWTHLRKIDAIGQEIAREIDNQHFDVVLVHPDRWTQAPALLKYLKTPSVYYMHEALRSLYETTGTEQPLAPSVRRSMDKVDPLIRLYTSKLRSLDQESTKSAVQLLANSSFTAENIQIFYGRQAEIAYLGVDSDLFRPVESVTKQDYVLSVGEIRQGKGFDFLIDALACLPSNRRPPLRIVANAADGNVLDKLVAQASERRVVLHIEIGIDVETLVLRYNQARAFVYAPHREPFGLVVLEAGACGIPVVAVAEGGMLETVNHEVTGLLAPRDPATFASLLAGLLGDAELSLSLGEQARKAALDKWSWDASVSHIESVLKRCAATPQANCGTFADRDPAKSFVASSFGSEVRL